MKSRAVSTGVLTGLVFSFLFASAPPAYSADGNERMSRIERAGSIEQRRVTARKTESFRSERTDSWLCTYVSPLFCSNLVPALPTTPDQTKAPSTPTRGRN
jgi:hypothetical protein